MTEIEKMGIEEGEQEKGGQDFKKIYFFPSHLATSLLFFFFRVMLSFKLMAVSRI